ncbi:MAG: zinc-binding dehydrogenase [Crocinitomicaceae bacterium]|nr:zinc-binding dehydrogenase [Crocinitomicaceae bacterium]MBT6516050.1 zinc-binding dehydrogenase [Crocinitomicaceae bacterium]
MKAAVLVRKGDPMSAFQIQEVPIPKPNENQVLIKVSAFGLNFADVMARNGLYRDAPPMPAILGYDVVGEVIEIVNDKDQHLLGKRVVAMTRFGGYAEYAITDARACAIIADSTPSAVAAALATQYCTAYRAACESVHLFQGDCILIHAAAGGVGTALSQIAKQKGCTIYGTAGSNEKFDYMKENGVDFPINYRTQDYLKVIQNQGHKLQVAFNSIGGSTFKKDYTLLEKGGTSVLYGVAERSGKKGGAVATLQLAWKFGLMSPIQFLVNSKGVIGVNMLHIADYQPLIIQRCLKAVVAMTESKILEPRIGGEFSIHDIGKAHAFLESRQSVGKIIVSW